MPTGAIVLGGNFVGLGVVRRLAAHRIPIWVLDTDRSKSIAQFSRYTKRFIVCPRDQTCEVLLKEGRQHGLDGWVVFPVSDEYVEEVSQHHDALGTIFRLVTPLPRVTQFALDKRLTYQRANELGIAAPWTLSGTSALSLNDCDVPYPVILKPAVNHHFFPKTNVKAFSVNSLPELQGRFAQMSEFIPTAEILIQERIPGGGENQFSFCGLCKDGVVLASLVARRTRQYPIEFGNASSFVETIDQPVVEAAGRRFLESIGFDGIAEVEFKFDPRDGKYKILDCNPRAWGWHTLGKAAGVDFVHLVFQQKTTGAGKPAAQRRPAAWLREITDPLAILKSSQPFVEFRRVLRAIVTRRVTFATFSLLDPVPFFAEFVLWATQGAARQKKAKDVMSGESVYEKS